MFVMSAGRGSVPRARWIHIGGSTLEKSLMNARYAGSGSLLAPISIITGWHTLRWVLCLSAWRLFNETYLCILFILLNTLYSDTYNGYQILTLFGHLLLLRETSLLSLLAVHESSHLTQLLVLARNLLQDFSTFRQYSVSSGRFGAPTSPLSLSVIRYIPRSSGLCIMNYLIVYQLCTYITQNTHNTKSDYLSHTNLSSQLYCKWQWTTLY
jgi:hypothetical protein